MKQIIDLKYLKPNTWFICPNPHFAGVMDSKNMIYTVSFTCPGTIREETKVYTEALTRAKHLFLSRVVLQEQLPIIDMIKECETADMFLIQYALEYKNV